VAATTGTTTIQGAFAGGLEKEFALFFSQIMDTIRSDAIGTPEKSAVTQMSL